MADLTAELNVEGIDSAATSFTDLGKSVQDFEPLAEKLALALGSITSTLDQLGKKIDDEVKSTKQKEDVLEEKKKELEQKRHQEEAEAEQGRLQAKVAQLVGGGINTAAYNLALDKVKEQEEAIQEASRRGLITVKEKDEAVAKLAKQYHKLQIEAAAYDLLGQGAMGRLAAGITNKLLSVPDRLKDAGKSQVAGIGSGLMGLVSSLPIAGGLFGLMMYGIVNQDRLNREAGEILNIAQATAGSLSSSGAAWLTSFQEKAQHYYAINKSELQGLVTTFKDGGYKIEEVLAKQNKSLGEVGTNILTMTLAIDKHFEMAGGTAARSVVSFTNDFGMSIKSAGDLYEKMAFAGSRSGIGVGNFLGYVQQGTSTLRQYGVSVENTAVVLTKLQDQYESMGMPKALAGTQAGVSLGQISGGMANLSASMQGYMAERMGMGTGLEGRMHFREGMERLSKGGADNSFLSDFIKQARQVAVEATGGDTTQARYFLEQQGFGFEGAKGIMAIGEKLEKGQTLESLSIKEQQALKSAFMTEGQKQGEIQKDTYRILQGMSDIGQGLLKIITNFVGMSIVFFKSMLTLATGTDDDKKRVKEQLDEFYKGMKSGAMQMWGGKDEKTGGFNGILTGMGGLLAPIAKPITDAIEWNPMSTDKVTEAVKSLDLKNVDYQTAEKAAVEAYKQNTFTGSMKAKAEHDLEWYREHSDRGVADTAKIAAAAVNLQAAKMEDSLANWFSKQYHSFQGTGTDPVEVAKKKADEAWAEAHSGAEKKSVVITVEAAHPGQKVRPSTRAVMDGH